MTLPATSQELGGRLPSSDERSAANALRPIIASAIAHKSELRVYDPVQKSNEAIHLHPSIGALLLEVLRHVAAGDAVTLVPTSNMMTTQQAADVLNVSRPYLIKLLEDRKIPHQKVGRHRRILATDLFEFKRRRDMAREEALTDLAAVDARML